MVNYAGREAFNLWSKSHSFSGSVSLGSDVHKCFIAHPTPPQVSCKVQRGRELEEFSSFTWELTLLKSFTLNSRPSYGDAQAYFTMFTPPLFLPGPKVYLCLLLTMRIWQGYQKQNLGNFAPLTLKIKASRSPQSHASAYSASSNFSNYCVTSHQFMALKASVTVSSVCYDS